MHEATVTASSVRRDGKGFKATLPEYGEVWLSLPDSLTNAVEWKKTYAIEFNVKPGTKGNFYNVTKVTPKGDGATQFAKDLNGGAARTADIGPHLAMWEKEALKALLLGKTGAEVRLLGIEARQVARDILSTNLDGKLPAEPELNDSLDDTF